MEKTFRFNNGVIKIGYNEKVELKTGREIYIKKELREKQKEFPGKALCALRQWHIEVEECVMDCFVCEYDLWRK